jgi:hypothetical protein
MLIVVLTCLVAVWLALAVVILAACRMAAGVDAILESGSPERASPNPPRVAPQAPCAMRPAVGERRVRMPTRPPLRSFE